MNKILQLISSVLIALLTTISISKAEVKVVASIKPIHSLVSYVMDGVGKPDVIVDGYNSPHGFSLKPSHAKMIENADLIIWVGEDLEAFLEKPLDTIAKRAVNVEIMDLSGVKKLKFREKNIFESHDDHGHGHKEKKHDDHGHGHKEKKHDDHGHKKAKHDDHGHEGHAHGEHDPHVWLDPMNAKVIIKEIEKQLVKLDPDNSSKYKANSKKAQSELDNLTKNIKRDLKGNLRFVVFHDAYQYFENRFGIKVLGALTVNPDVLPGAEQLSEIREVIEHEKVNCLFSEPQFNPAIIKSIAKDTKIKTGVLDPLGATLDKGKGMYSELLQSMYASFKGC
ncbi:zinc ABC transporter substrate-binding protein ZnuA [Candidatus Pelagibacter communis]|uniref:zinc ABC transporter substrate-binding protein ZnuA n=1 Tax=Pelagibacter ubique TaxID=198252 RepID=UPI00094D25FE|nr:zinc ABC transporter substrate-binding protein ZnuA [Candidatus Pelagibacter ubique]